jgi:hypothetical protein
MSFGSDFAELIKNDPSINTLINGGIRFENLEKNWDTKKYWVVYTYDKSQQFDALDQKNILSTYAITLTVIGPNAKNVDNITTMFINYLNGNSYNKILDIWQVNDVKSNDLDMGIYTTEIQFESFI